MFIFLDFFLFIIDVSLRYYTNFNNFEQTELVENLSSTYLPYQFQPNLQPFLLSGKMTIFI